MIPRRSIPTGDSPLWCHSRCSSSASCRIPSKDCYRVAGMPTTTKTELTRSLRERDLLLLFVGSVIVSGIFLTPGLIQRQVGGSVGYSLLVWLLGGVLSLLGALTYAELAAANPEAGGLYCYIRDAFGRMPAFLYGWSLLLVIASATIAALAHAFTAYLQEIIPLPPAGKIIIPMLMIAAVTA